MGRMVGRWLNAWRTWNHKDSYWRFWRDTRVYVFGKKENAAETYDRLKKKYLSLKAILNIIGVNLNDIDRIIILSYHFIINFSSVFTQVPKTMNFEEPLIKQIQETCEPSSGNSSVLAYALTRSGSRMPRSVASSPGKCIRIRFGNGSCSMKSIKLPVTVHTSAWLKETDGIDCCQSEPSVSLSKYPGYPVK